MPTPRIARYGSWKSPITSDLIVAGSISLQEIHGDGTDIYWIEGRPQEAGRNVLVKRSADGTVADVTPAPFNARTRVHEYGGGAAAVKDGVVYFSNFADNKLYRQDGLAAAPSIISQNPESRYADAIVDSVRKRIICVREDHGQSPSEPANTIVDMAADGMRAERILVSGNDFYSNPRLSPDGKRLGWICWNHPHMPWTSTELWVANVADDGSIVQPKKIAGNGHESIFQPEWSPDGVLHFVSDSSGWWNLYRVIDEGKLEAILPMEAEFGQPQWVFGMSTYSFLSDGRIASTYREKGESRLVLINSSTGDNKPISIPWPEIDRLRVAGNTLIMLAGGPDKAASVMTYEVESGKTEVLRQSTNLLDDPVVKACISAPRLIEFPSGDKTAFGWYYPPHNPNYVSHDELPPLVVKSHGGPTASASAMLNLKIQFWTSRGYAVVDVDYGGSTGYGREYRDRLYRQWGVVDLEDCTNAARFLCDASLADRNRVAITGGSAGGYTTLCALTFKDFFRIGASYYGVADVEALAKDTHKFESRYMDWLIGKYPEEKELYRQRSPIHFTNQLSVPVIFFQGSEDKVVPPEQAEMMVEAIRGKGLPFDYFLFEGEQHGFRRAENIKRAIDAELYFYSSHVVRAGLSF